jgi:hypothetical protein
VGHHIADPPFDEKIDEEGFPPERRDRVKCAVHLAECPLNRGHFGNMSEVTGHAEVLRIGKLRAGQNFVEYFQGAALMGQYRGAPGVVPEGCHFDCEGADVHAYVRHANSSWNQR